MRPHNQKNKFTSAFSILLVNDLIEWKNDKARSHKSIRN